MDEQLDPRIIDLLSCYDLLKGLVDTGIIYGIHPWGVHMTMDAYIDLFGDTGGNRLSTSVRGIEFFALRARPHG